MTQSVQTCLYRALCTRSINQETVWEDLLSRQASLTHCNTHLAAHFTHSMLVNSASTDTAIV